NKNLSGPTLYRVGGSIAFLAAARVAHLVLPDPADPTGERRLFLPLKTNLSRPPAGLAYIIQTHILHYDRPTAPPDRIVSTRLRTTLPPPPHPTLRCVRRPLPPPVLRPPPRRTRPPSPPPNRLRPPPAFPAPASRPPRGAPPKGPLIPHRALSPSSAIAAPIR